MEHTFSVLSRKWWGPCSWTRRCCSAYTQVSLQYRPQSPCPGLLLNLWLSNHPGIGKRLVWSLTLDLQLGAGGGAREPWGPPPHPHTHFLLPSLGFEPLSASLLQNLLPVPTLALLPRDTLVAKTHVTFRLGRPSGPTGSARTRTTRCLRLCMQARRIPSATPARPGRSQTPQTRGQPPCTGRYAHANFPRVPGERGRVSVLFVFLSQHTRYQAADAPKNVCRMREFKPRP